jgi:hypothetical protein
MDTLELKQLHGKVSVLLGSQLYQQLQGGRLKQVIVELGDKDFSAGLFFVAISQVKILQGLDLFYNTLGSIHQPLEFHRL